MLFRSVVFAVEHGLPGHRSFNVSDRPTLTVRQLAEMVAGAAGAPSPRSVPSWLALLAAPFGEAVERLTGRPMPLTPSRVRAALAPSDLPCERLVAAGFRHVETTEAGIGEVVSWVVAGEPFSIDKVAAAGRQKDT